MQDRLSLAIPSKKQLQSFRADARVTFFVAKKVTKENSLIPRQICHLTRGRGFSMRHPAASKNGARPVRRPLGLQKNISSTMTGISIGRLPMYRSIA
jgi:hypothetical protein